MVDAENADPRSVAKVRDWVRIMKGIVDAAYGA